MLKTKELWKISFVAGALNVLLNFILVPFYGIWGSVLATFIATMFMGFRGYLLKSFRDNNPVNYYPLFWFMAICGSTILVFLMKDIHVIYKTMITLMLLTISSFYFYKNKLKLSF
jgi:O-antigen/teichoic acid export membrane protein